MASNARLFGDDTVLSAILTSDHLREPKHLGRRMRHIVPALWQDECEAIVLRGNLAKFSQNEEMSVALENTDARRITEASPHNKIVVHLTCVLPPSPWYGLSLLGQALERTRETLRQNTSGDNQPDILASG